MSSDNVRKFLAILGHPTFHYHPSSPGRVWAETDLVAEELKEATEKSLRLATGHKDSRMDEDRDGLKKRHNRNIPHCSHCSHCSPMAHGIMAAWYCIHFFLPDMS